MRNITSYPLDVPYHTSAAATDPARSLCVPQPTLRSSAFFYLLSFLLLCTRTVYLTWYDIYRRWNRLFIFQRYGIIRYALLASGTISTGLNMDNYAIEKLRSRERRFSIDEFHQ